MTGTAPHHRTDAHSRSATDTVKERQDMTSSVQYGRPVGPDPVGVLAAYEGWVRRAPGSAAVTDGAHSWTYRQIDEAADALVRTWDGRVRPGDLVGVCLDRSAALVVTAVALARVGAVYLPLGPRPGERRLAAVGEDVGVACLIGAPEVLPQRHREAEHLALPLPAEGVNAVAGTVAAFLPPAPGARPAPPGALYAVLTSGSTGRPKAVAVAEPALSALLSWYREETGLGPGDRQTLLIGVAFDPHVMELWGALTSGATLVPAPDAVRWDPGALTDWWRDAAVTVAVTATPMTEPLLDRPWPQDLALRHLVVGGDRMRRRPGPDVTAVVHNAYGPAEATVVTTTHSMRASDDDAREDAAPPIGLPLPGVCVLVTDTEGKVVARGEDGELCVGGVQLAMGYLDAELTASRFAALPGADLPPEVDRVYRTGDRVRMRADGALEFLGRLDDQVKISGVRIEPAEVEAALEQDPAVRSAVVVAPRDAEGRARLVAYVLPVAAGSDATEDAPAGPHRGSIPAPAPDPDALLASVRAWLPEQAVPSAVRVVEAFALDANGKVDRAALLKREAETREQTDAAAADGAAALPADATANERLVLETVRKLLDRPSATLTDNFTDIGGTSLAAARLLTAVERETGVRLRAPELLRQPDLRAVVAVLDKRCAAAAARGAGG
ncbi:non-ribosomal peptide synthetase (plasmid) [Streptomyces sp. CA-294286]|uniref:non-ribosomal peptide synthetase n=1 Tax=Streptomyces sp. CA-294286 TaxID=3240070 RepID=UPI003D928D0B